jgi:TRAP-type C4-dicarboxylate transport system permease large subunit
VLNVVAGTARIGLNSVIGEVWPHLLSLTALMFLFVLFPQLVMVPAGWLRGGRASP